MPVFVLPFYEKVLADIFVKDQGPSKIPLFGQGPGFGLTPTAVITLERDYGVSRRGLECSFPSCGNLLE